MSFLPVDYEAPQQTGGGSYFKAKNPGDYKLRILSDAITGFEYWNSENKPVRVRKDPTQRRAELDIRPEKDGSPGRIKHFWSVVVWNYNENALQCWQIPQASIRQKIEALYSDADWGHPKEYNITLRKEGKDLSTEYSVIPSPNKSIPNEAIQQWKDASINLEALFDGGNPMNYEGPAVPGAAGSANECRPVYLLHGMVQRANGDAELLDKAQKWAMAPNQYSDIDKWSGGEGDAYIASVCNAPAVDASEIPF